MSHRFFATALFFVHSLMLGQAQVMMKDFLKSALEDPKVKTISDQIGYLKEKPYRLSPLQRFEFRTQNRELLSYQQEYALRLTSSNPWEVRNNNQYFKEYQSSLNFENELVLKEALILRYQKIIYLVHYRELQSLAQQSERLISNQLSILERQLGSSFFDADDYVDLRIEQLDKSTELEEMDFEITSQIHAIERLFPQAFGKTLLWNVESVIPATRVKPILDSLVAESTMTTWIEWQQQKLKLAQSEYKLEKSNITMGFLQTEYDRRRVEQNRTPVNISLGVTIPITNPNKGDMAKRHLETIEAQFDLEEAQSEAKSDKMIFADKLAKLVNRYNSLETKMGTLKQGNLPGTLQTLKGGDPIITLQFEESVLKLNVLLAKIRRDILLTYIDYLALTDRLQQRPLVNFLSKDLEEM